MRLHSLLRVLGGHGSVVLALGALAVVLPLPGGAQPRAGGTLVYGERPPLFGNLNPHANITLSGPTDRVLSMLYEPLYRYRFGDEKWEGVLATGFRPVTPRRGKSAFAVSLRPARWHDGSPVTAADVVFTYEYLQRTAASTRTRELFKGVLESVRAGENAATVVFEFKGAVSDPQIYMREYIIPQSRFDGRTLAPNGEDLNTVPLGTGPFLFGRFVARGQPEFRRFDAYHSGPAQLDRMQYNYFTDPVSMLETLEGGGIQMVVEVPPENVQRLERNPSFEVAQRASNNVFMVAIKQRPGHILANESVRRALTMAINRDQLLRNWFGGKGEVLASPISGQSPYWDPDVQALPFAPTEAQRMLERAGAAGAELSIAYPTSEGADTRVKDIVRSIADALNAVGLRIRETPLTQTDFQAALFRQGAYDLAVMRWEFNEAYDITPLFRTPGTVSALENQNILGYSDPEFDALARNYELSGDADRRRSLSQAMQKMLNQRAPAIFLVSYQTAYAYGSQYILPEGSVDQFQFFTYSNKWWRRGTAR